MRNLTLRIAEPRQWDAYYSASGDADVLFCPTEDDLTVGEVVRVKVVFLGGPLFFCSGVVVWRRPAGTSGVGKKKLRPGIGVRLNASERTKVTYIRGFARGGLLDKRATPRLPVRLQVTYRASTARRVNFTRDITETGILLSAAELLPVETEVDLSIVPPLELAPMKLTGKVVRHVEDDRGRAMGIQMQFAADDQRRRFLALVRDIERAFNTGKLGEEFVAK